VPNSPEDPHEREEIDVGDECAGEEEASLGVAMVTDSLRGGAVVSPGGRVRGEADGGASVGVWW
jgi:hypothetical protein